MNNVLIVIKNKINENGIKHTFFLIIKKPPSILIAKLKSLFKKAMLILRFFFHKEGILQISNFLFIDLGFYKKKQIEFDKIQRLNPSFIKSEFYEEEQLDISNSEKNARVIAFYLPQFHPIPENDLWWGEGFTEWTNVTRAVPLYKNHYQPHLPSKMGFYDLRNIETIEKQYKMAKKSGVTGFCFYYYWFNGKKLLETPLNILSRNSQIKLPFCLCWANENWTRRWDGQEKEVLIEQAHSENSDLNFIKDIFPLFNDPRYLTIGGSPILIIYRASMLPNAKRTFDLWRKFCLDKIGKKPYIIIAQSFGIKDPHRFGADAAVEFPPHGLNQTNISHEIKNLDPSFKGRIYSYTDILNNYDPQEKQTYKLFKTSFPSWDNTPRTLINSTSFYGSSPPLFGKWFRNNLMYTLNNFTEDEEKIVFVNAWNEWAEGAHLEPDHKYGYAFLNCVARELTRGSTLLEGL